MRFGTSLILAAGVLITAGIIFSLPRPSPPVGSDFQPANKLELSITQQQGLALVTSYCSDCHAIAQTGNSPNPRAPVFRQIHQRIEIPLLSNALVHGLYIHAEMPEFEFDADQANAIISYLEILQTAE